VKAPKAIPAQAAGEFWVQTLKQTQFMCCWHPL